LACSGFNAPGSAASTILAINAGNFIESFPTAAIAPFPYKLDGTIDGRFGLDDPKPFSRQGGGGFIGHTRFVKHPYFRTRTATENEDAVRSDARPRRE